jgi:uncharacterized membrane protein YvlD (DUF360 family)
MIGAQILTRVVANFSVIAILGALTPGFELTSPQALVTAALVLAMVASLGVWIVFALLPLRVGLALLLPINLGAFYATGWLVDGFAVRSLGWALAGTVLLGAVNALISDLFVRWWSPPPGA